MYKLLIYLAVPLSALLTFLVQPITGKFLLPWHGGSASTWVTSMVFFQAALLLGYGFAYTLQKFNYRRQILTMMVLAIAGFLLLQLPPVKTSSTHVTGVLFSLVISLLPALLLTTSLGIVLQGWMRIMTGRVPYHLYSISNVGSLLALLIYPFLIEPFFGMSVQTIAFRTLLGIVSVLLILLSVMLLRSRESWLLLKPDESGKNEKIALLSGLYWLLISAAACAAMISVMRMLSGELGSNPISWILPLGAYLLSFIITFSGSWRSIYGPLLTVILWIMVMMYTVFQGFNIISPDHADLVLLLLALLASSHLAHGLVYLRRPRENFATFYLVIATGGVVGGVFASLLAPAIFGRTWEMPISFMIILAAGAWDASSWLPGKKNIAGFKRWLFPAAAVLPILLILGIQVRNQSTDGSDIVFKRNIYGQFTIYKAGDEIRCISETTLHGVQAIDPGPDLQGTAYYHPASAVGMTIRALKNERPKIRVGVVGLGVGTLAAFGRPGDSYVFWDINPLTFDIARDYFKFVPNSEAEVEFILRDGRLGIEESESSFDLLVIDAFSGDGIPFHLITREAISGALSRVENGYLIIHISNRYLDLFPVLAGHARALGYGCARIQMTTGKIPDEEKAYSSVYALYFPRGKFQETIDKINMFAHPDAQYMIFDEIGYPDDSLIHWTDDRHAIMDVLFSR